MKSAQKKVAAPPVKSKKIKKEKTSKPALESNAAGMFKCAHCPRVFTKSQSLGGHTSKSHPEMSLIYK